MDVVHLAQMTGKNHDDASMRFWRSGMISKVNKTALKIFQLVHLHFRACWSAQ